MRKHAIILMGILLSINIHAAMIGIEKDFFAYNISNKPLINQELKFFVSETLVYGDGKNDKSEKTLSTDVYLTALTDEKGQFKIKTDITDLTKSEKISDKTIKTVGFEVYLMVDGYNDVTFNFDGPNTAIILTQN